MAQIALSNTAPETVLVGDISSSTGTIIVESGVGSAFPAVPFRVGIDREAMLVTDVTGDTFTVTRGYDGTASAPHVSGDTVQHIHTATDFPFRVDDTTGLYHGQAGIDMETFAITNVGEFALSLIGGDITNVGSITSNSGANLVLKPNGATENVQLATSTGKKRIVAETSNIRFYTANGLSETLVWDEAGIEWELQAKFNVNSQPFVGIDALVSDATKNLVLRPADSDKAVRINNYLDDIRIAVAAADITFYQGDGTTPTLAWNDASTEWQLAATFNVSGENITGVEVLASSADQDLSLRPGNAAYAVNLEAADGSDRITVETNDIRFFKADGLTQTLRWDQTGNEWEFGAAINANTFTLSNVADPTDDSHVGDRGYNDGRYAPLAGGAYLPITGGTLTGDLSMDNSNDITNVLNISGSTTGTMTIRPGTDQVFSLYNEKNQEVLRIAAGYVANKFEAVAGMKVTASSNTNSTLSLAGFGTDTHTANLLQASRNSGGGLAAAIPYNGIAVQDYDLTRKDYVDDLVALYLALSGGTMTGDINMAGNILESVDATLYLDATNTGAAAGDIYIRTDDATGTRRNRVYIDGDGSTAFYDSTGSLGFLVSTAAFQVEKTLQMQDNLIASPADPSAGNHVGDRDYNDARYALTGDGVTNGDLHDHSGGDGAAISHADLIGVSASQHHVRYTDAEAIAAVGTVMNGVPSGASLPLTGIAGDLFFLTTDEKLYRHNGTTWLVTTATSDLSGTITETQIEDNAITTGKLDANAVTAAKIEAGTITTAEIATDTILAGNIAAGAIEASEIATGAVTADAILAGAVTTDAMTANTIDGDRIQANTLDAAKITAGTITTDRMTAGTIDADRLIADSITSTQIDAGTITTTELAANLVLVTGQAISASYSAGVSGWQIQQSGTAEFNEVIVRGALIGQAGSSISADYLTAGTIDASTIFVENIDADNITAGTLSADRIAAGSLDASKITAGTITTDRMTANTIDGSVITAGSLDAAKITAGSITTDRMTAGTIDADRLTALSIEAAQINTGAITTDKMTAGTIDADRLIANSITATEIASGTITTTELQADMVLVAGQALSASYVLNTSGWKIWQDGSAEFNNVTVRGALIAQAGSTISADYLTAGTIDAAVIDVTNLDADNITVGTLNADRIAAGSLDAVKITAGTITTDRMTANTIDGDRILADSLDAAKIVAGSITTDRMTANTIDGDRITAGTLDAVKIVAGSITTDRFSANTISGTIITAETLDAAKITAGSIGTDRMTAGTINADRLTAGSVTATQLAADSVTAGKLAVQTMSNNLMPNPDFVWDSIGGSDDPHEYSTTYGGSFSAGTARLTGGVRSLRYTYGTGGPGTTWTLLGGTGLGKFPAKEGDKFYVSMWVRTAGTAPLASPYYAFHVNYREADDTYIGSDSVGSVSLTTSWTKVSVTGTAPANTSFFNVYLNHEYNGSETGAETVEYSNVVVERVSPTVLIEDGAITTDKLEVNMVLVTGQALSGSYSAGLSGWKIAQDGTAEFSNVNIRGDSTVDGAVITENLSASAITTGTLGAETITLSNSASSKIQSFNGTDWYIRGDGSALFANVDVTGALHTGAGSVIDADYISAGTIGAETITLTNSASSKIQSSNGTDWYIRGDGVALFADVTISGSLDTSSIIGDLELTTGNFYSGPVLSEHIEIRSGGSPEYYSSRINWYEYGNTGTNWFASIWGDANNLYLDLIADGGIRLRDNTEVTLGNKLTVPDGSATAPALRLSSSNHGIYRYDANNIGIAANGAASLIASSGALTIMGSYLYFNGTTSTEYLEFNDGANYARFVLDGGERARINTSGQVLSGAGTESLPGHSFIVDPNTGMYRGAENILSFATGGANRGYFQNGSTSSTAGTKWGGTLLVNVSNKTLGSAAGNMIHAQSWAFDVGANNVGFEVQALRDATGSDWTTAAVGIRRVTDATAQASLWWYQSRIGVNKSGPQWTLEVAGTFGAAPSTTTSTSGNRADWFVGAAGTYQLYRYTSSRRWKREIDYDTDYLADYKLKPVTFFGINEHDYDAHSIGFIAEDVADNDPRLGTYDEDGEVDVFSDIGVLAILAAKANRADARYDALEARIEELEKLIRE